MPLSLWKAFRRSWILWVGPAITVTLVLAFLTYHRSLSASVTPTLHLNVQGNLASNGPKHPVAQLVELAENRLASLRAHQSTSLKDAVRRYRARHGMNPPPNFERWYNFAVESGTELIDEFDEIQKSLFLFWALKPEAIRQRTQEALRGGNMLLRVSVQDGKVQIHEPGQDNYQAIATEQMISKFAEHLPNMELAFNIHDEPRVVVPREDVDVMTKTAHDSIQRSQKSHQSHTCSVNNRNNIDNGTISPVFPLLVFNHLEHQQTWPHGRMSCPAATPARAPNGVDYDTTFAFQNLHFVYNTTAFSDVCLTPTTSQLIGLFNHPNAFSISHDLVPVFSASKISTFHDILYPSPYYYAEKTFYDDNFAVSWEEKAPKLYWRGATSGGFSEDGIWKHLLRQSVLLKLSSTENLTVLQRDAGGSWTAQEVAHSSFDGVFDLKFTDIKQCDFHDCAEMRQSFGSYPLAPQEEAWKHRYLLDMDGNALSGRFHALLRSLSLPFKLAYFREWHIGRLMPWKHYVPVSSSTEEYAELIRFFEDEAEGQVIAKQLALSGRDWANRVLRKEDMEVYMFRLLLEYGRLIDDNRDCLG